MPDATQSFNRYAYCLNNPLKYTDPSGEIAVQLVGFAISYIIQQFHPPSLNSYMPNYYKDRSSIIGFGVGALVNCFIPGANGLIKGAILGGFSGGLSGGLTAGIDAVLSGGDFGDAFWSGFRSGFLSGMITGGIKGGLTARQYGLNMLTGEPRYNMNDLVTLASLQQPEFTKANLGAKDFINQIQKSLSYTEHSEALTSDQLFDFSEADKNFVLKSDGMGGNYWVYEKNGTKISLRSGNILYDGINFYSPGKGKYLGWNPKVLKSSDFALTDMYGYKYGIRVYGYTNKSTVLGCFFKTS